MIIKRAKSAPIGSTIQHAGIVAPVDYIVCGQAVSRTVYAKLYDEIGTIYGVGDGATTFDLPPVNRYSLSTNDGMSVGVLSGASSHSHTAAGTALTVDQMPSHTHTVQAGISPTDAASAGGARASDYTQTGQLTTASEGAGQTHTHTIDSVSNIPPSVKFLLCIKYR